MDNITSIVLSPSPIILNATLNQAPQTWLKDWLPLIIFAVASTFTLLTWLLNEWVKRSSERHLRKAERYVELIDLIENLMESENKKPGDPDLKPKFIHQINLCWLYCSDDVVRKTFDLVSKFNDDEISNGEKEDALSDLMITLRKDVLKMPTKLNPADYKNLRPAMLRRFVLKVESAEFKIEGGKAKMIHKNRNGNVILPSNQEEAKKKK